jgi:excinuclease ABC subunit C
MSTNEDPPTAPAATSKKKESAQERRARIAERVRTLPTDPGCYIMKDRHGEIFYVGKATDLRARVRSYFSGSDTRQFVDWLDDLLDDLDIIVVRNEKEALLLERTLVRQHQPRFNVKLRDDKNFIHLRLVTKPTTDPTAPRRRRYPRVEVVRGPRDEGAGVRIFGPYHSATSARATLRVLNRHFQLRTCRDSVIDNRARPCLQHQIGRCPAPCVVDVDGYAESLQDVALFLSGRRTELADRLRERMLQLSDRLEFESAARVRDQMASVQSALDDQAVTDVEGRRNQDVFGAERRGSVLVITRVTVRDGRMQGLDTWDFDKAEFPTEELLASFISQAYDTGGDVDAGAVPDEILLPIPLSADGSRTTESVLADVFTERRGKKVEVRVPQRGHNNKLVEIAQKNAVTTIEEKLRKLETRNRGLETLRERLGLAALPRVIECFDISLFQGTDAVASQICFVDGAADKSRYRRMNIKTVEGTDDFAMLYEALTRRFKRGKEHRDLPDLIIIDGGKGQLNVALTAAKDTGVVVVNDLSAGPAPEGGVRVALASIAKARSFNVKAKKGGKERARPNTPREEAPVGAVAAAVDDDLQASPERLFMPGAKDPLTLRPHTAERFLVEQIRDEAHRFAITGHRGRRKRRTLRSVLDEIDGIGPAKRKALLAHFGSAQAVADADVAVIAAVKGVGTALATRIKAALGVDVLDVDAGADADAVDDVLAGVPVDENADADGAADADVDGDGDTRVDGDTSGLPS